MKEPEDKKKKGKSSCKKPLMLRHVDCQLPQDMGILSGEVELISRYLGDLLSTFANDNGVMDD
ncbi:MAG: hypothetical protein CMF31_05620 [Kordiimonas sp.]|nr:hypothetical protein [Kordiimonas sp.]|tara:strand:+ start:257 stop:445 length:189 start_codon:yes stop_codon:yes gene_type:complete